MNIINKCICIIILLSYFNCGMQTENILEKRFLEVWPSNFEGYQEELKLSFNEFVDFQEFINYNINRFSQESVREVFQLYERQNDFFSKITFELEDVTYKETDGLLSGKGENYFFLKFKLKIINKTEHPIDRVLTTLAIRNTEEDLYLTDNFPLDASNIQEGGTLSTLHATTSSKSFFINQVSNFKSYLEVSNSVYEIKFSNGEVYSSPPPQ